MDQLPTLLVSITPDALPVAGKALCRHVHLVPALNIEDAIKTLREKKIDLILCGIFFDESRMFDLLGYVQANHRHIPFIVCRVLKKPIPPITLEALRIAAVASGAVGFVEMPDRDRDAEELSYSEFRKAVMSYLPSLEHGTHEQGWDTALVQLSSVERIQSQPNLPIFNPNVASSFFQEQDLTFVPVIQSSK